MNTSFSEVSKKKSIAKAGRWKAFSLCWSDSQPATDVLAAAEKKPRAKQRGI